MEGRAVFEEKARKAFRFFDLNKDGIVTREEMAKNGDIISSLGPSSKFEKDRTRVQFTKWVDAMFPEGHINEESFCKKNYEFWYKEKEACAFEDHETYRNIFHRLDVNKDSYISEEELANYYGAFGYDDKNFVKKVFTALDKNKDGLISEEEFVEAFSRYWTDEPVFEFLYDSLGNAD